MLVDMDRRLIQVWLMEDPPGVAEVTEHVGTPGALACTCPKHTDAKPCLHVLETTRRIKVNGGHFFLKTTTPLTKSEVEEARQGLESYREMVLRKQSLEILG